MDGVEGFPPSPEYGESPRYPIESVDNALRILLLLGERPRLRLTDVSQYLDVASSTAHRLLMMLQYRGFVRQEPSTRGYIPGPTLDGLAFGVLRRLDVRTRARPVLERLNADLNETVHLGRLEGSDVHFIDSIESGRALRVGGRLGRTMPAHCTSNGKAMLATLTEADLFRIYPDEELTRLTPNSVGTRTDLVRELAEVRSQGFATSQEESEEGVSSLAVALSSGPTPLAVTASAPVSRMTAGTRETVLAQLLAAAEEIDKLLL
ncbi:MULTISPECIES: IclR family transcriptional regulator [Pseudonocardia]|jgi:DNA-binding IclR family transcriptional regulator|uniref:DNA-binding IclR family transcriptional regulator n=1 Tax=Pseudonocardia alni TaxID=33907 RepID=A0A852VTG5_PSEA5|nr:MULTISPECIES: IclR family transcriptional regulator [Pseudonocardia]MCO7192793.1 IclR family transcriptional regulator [Pseudonocardia sp. McavD-2-B]MYW75090.1 helix-turn-helix domain-containing protein [Pseudonocardia sp. SID8383]NYG00278.1 DNA-binding IclR family transcriptional regulator [Pseudonocardia antarctica]OJG07867.1 Pectin degradation repressor protein KdgR [Pseudonocardia autotrophica]